jgi:hypothetical protein
MKSPSESNLPAKLARGRERFEKWRSKRKTRSRLPERLWLAAVELAREYGLNKTARTLRLDYYGLKKRVASLVSGDDAPRTGTPQFLELLSGESNSTVECTIECQSAGGSRIRIHLQGRELPELTALSSSLWSRDR